MKKFLGYLILGVAVGAIVYTNGSVVGAWLLILAAGIAIYFLPALIALHRGHHQILAIFLLNLFLGWSFLGWIASLVWSATAIRHRDALGYVA